MENIKNLKNKKIHLFLTSLKIDNNNVESFKDFRKWCLYKRYDFNIDSDSFICSDKYIEEFNLDLGNLLSNSEFKEKMSKFSHKDEFLILIEDNVSNFEHMADVIFFFNMKHLNQLTSKYRELYGIKNFSSLQEAINNLIFLNSSL
ncbi:MAG: hypothetical protein ACQESP_11080 [Candidatus Muiribacteriota bacterium]